MEDILSMFLIRIFSLNVKHKNYFGVESFLFSGKEEVILQVQSNIFCDVTWKDNMQKRSDLQYHLTFLANRDQWWTTLKLGQYDF